MNPIKALLLTAALACAANSSAHSQTVVKHIQTEKAAIATGVWVGDTYYLSGQLASPVAPTAVTPPDAAKAAPPVYGDTKAQSASVFIKIQKALQEQGLDMKDVVKMTVFLGPEPATGKLDFPAMQSEYLKYFGTVAQPNKPARSAFQVAALAAPWALVEIEVIAVKSK